MSNQKVKIVDGFVWLLITDKAKEVYQSGAFDGSIYALYDDDIETEFIETYEELIDALERGLEIAIEVGRPRNTTSKWDLYNDRSSYLFKIVSYHVSNICNEIMNEDDKTSKKLGTKDAKDVLLFTHMMGSFESIMENLDALTCKIVENVDMNILDDSDEVLYDHVYNEFLNNYKK